MVSDIAKFWALVCGDRVDFNTDFFCWASNLKFIGMSFTVSVGWDANPLYGLVRV